jgi:hypothetical protein
LYEGGGRFQPGAIASTDPKGKAPGWEPDNFLIETPKDFGPAELCQLVDEVRDCFGSIRCRQVTKLAARFNDPSGFRKMTLADFREWVTSRGNESTWFYHVSLDRLLESWPRILQLHKQDCLGRLGYGDARDNLKAACPGSMRNEVCAQVQRAVISLDQEELLTGKTVGSTWVSFQPSLAIPNFIALLVAGRDQTAAQSLAFFRNEWVAWLFDHPTEATAYNHEFPVLGKMLGLGKWWWINVAQRAHKEFGNQLRRAMTADAWGVPQYQAVRLSPYAGS